MNCYYSNLIEGHNTNPVDIDRAMNRDFSREPAKRELQLESRAHIEVSTLMEERLRNDKDLNIASADFLKWLHFEFYKRMPEEYRMVRNKETGKVSYVIPGEFRKEDVIVGRHVPPPPDVLDDFLRRFMDFYAYLSYAKTIEDKDNEKRNQILTLLRRKCTEVRPPHEDELVDSPFEQEVYDILCQNIDSSLVIPQYKIGGFKVDFAILSPTKTPLVAIECDGKAYHSSDEAYAYDVFRQEQLENFGLTVYRIWSTNWWRKTDNEIHKLVQFIKSSFAGHQAGQIGSLNSEGRILEH
jgi:very-short-patch-repair endonuclease